jgi:hypothetical protein
MSLRMSGVTLDHPSLLGAPGKAVGLSLRITFIQPSLIIAGSTGPVMSPSAGFRSSWVDPLAAEGLVGPACSAGYKLYNLHTAQAHHRRNGAVLLGVPVCLVG